MIASVEGTVTALTADGVVVRVGGVGLALHTTAGTRARLRVGEEALLATSLVVREDSLTLYGFADDDERSLFELLQTASGVGPRLAQAVLTVHPPDAVRRALVQEDLVALCLVPGIGRKGAQRLVLELKDKALLPGTATPAAPPAAPGWQGTLASATFTPSSEKRTARTPVVPMSIPSNTPEAMAAERTPVRACARSLPWEP